MRLALAGLVRLGVEAPGIWATKATRTPSGAMLRLVTFPIDATWT